MTTKTKPKPKPPPDSPAQGTYSFVDDLAASVPELKALLAQAAAGKWTPQRFADAMQKTVWWRTNSDTAKQMIDLQAVNPAQYAQQVAAAQEHVELMAKQLGVNLTSAQIKAQATADLFQGLDDATLQSDLGQLYTTAATDGSGGTGVTLDGQIKQLAQAYGVPVTQSWVDSAVKTALTGGTGVEGATAELIQMATSTYPGLAAQLAAGQTVAQVAQPYMAAMAQTLEIPESQITLQDQTIQKALQTVPATPPGAPAVKPVKPPAMSPGAVKMPGDPGTATGSAGGAAPPAPTTTPLWQFNQQLRQDPRWQQTDNAKASAYSMVHSLGSAWGFSS